jgi:cytochrome c553
MTGNATVMRSLFLWRSLAALLLLACGWDTRAVAADGATVYREQCARCHGAGGEGTSENYDQPLVGDHSIAQLAALIAETMPADLDEKCSAEDSRAVAEYIYNAFYSPEAQFRNKPARVEISRLTIRQHQNAVTDLIGSFRAQTRRPQAPDEDRGLVGRYFAARDFRPQALQLERTDKEVNFDFGVGPPEGGKFEPHSFSIYWEGNVTAPDTGDYEFIVRTEHAARLWVNNKREPLIDAWVKSGDDSEFRRDVRLLGGRTYPIKLEFSKAKQGVDDSGKKRKKPKPEVKASIALAWRRPHHTEEVIASRYLSKSDGPELFVLHTAFPPDDRSVGYERGTAISKSWEEATTEAAIEVAGYVEEHLNEMAGVADDAPDREARLIEFCHKFAERAFRRPLSDDQRLMYVDRQFAEAVDPKLAVKHVVLLVLKSPRFLYREVGGGTAISPHDMVARMAFGLWDSIPDEAMRQAAAIGRPSDRSQVNDQLARMLRDPRAQTKLREFLLTWLKVSQPPDVSKDPHAYPEFTAETVSDLRTSLELAIDDVLSEESADFRELMLGDSMFMNGRLAALYGYAMPKDAPFEKVRFQPEQRAGVVSHPYLLACFAYANASSPIHRGVFISRNLLGRSLKQPPVAVAPLPVELHGDLTTRERVTLQTKPEACQTCHSMINPLGFSLEEFDAIGRYREREKNRPVDAGGSYTTQSGDVVKFDGVAELAVFLAQSEESQAAFVQQLFQHIVKQPIRAYGEDCWERLQRSFVSNNFNIHHLAAEIVAVSALPIPEE